MPRIPRFQSSAPIPGPVGGPRAQASDFYEGSLGLGDAAQEIGQGVSQLGQAIARQREQLEVSDLAASLSEAQGRLQNRLATLSDDTPPEQDVSDLFLQEADKELQAIGKRAKSPAARAYYQKAAAELRGHFTVTAYQAQRKRFGEHVATSHTKMMTNLSGAVRQDPSGFDAALANLDAAIEARVASGFSRTAADQLKLEDRATLAESALHGLLDRNPALAQEQIRSGAWNEYLGADKQTQLLERAEAEIREDETAARVKQAHELAVQQAQRQAEEDAAYDEATNRMTEDDPTKWITPEEIRGSKMSTGQKIQMFNWLEKRANDRRTNEDREREAQAKADQLELQEEERKEVKEVLSGIWKSNFQNKTALTQLAIEKNIGKEGQQYLQEQWKEWHGDQDFQQADKRRIRAQEVLKDVISLKITDPGELVQMAVRREIDDQDVSYMKAMIETVQSNPLVKSGMQKLEYIAEGYLVGTESMLTGKKDPAGRVLYTSFMQLAEQKVRERQKEGKPLEPLFDVNSPEFLGHWIGTFRPTMKEQMERDMKQMRGAFAAGPVKPRLVADGPPGLDFGGPKDLSRMPGETITQWEKRVGR